MNNPIGVLINYAGQADIADRFRKAQAMGMTSCQLCIWNEKYYGAEYAASVKAAMEETGFRVSTVWAGWSGPCEWNAYYGPSTIGLVPPAYRESRVKALIAGSDFAAAIGVPYVATHVGFLPADPYDPKFVDTVGALRHVCKYMQQRGQTFLFETGQETPMTIVRAIEAIGTGNCGINFDTANLILYGNGNSLDAVGMFGKYIRDTHIKDGFYPEDGFHNGRQMPVGEGCANIPAIIKKLREIGYEGAFTIEREISGEQQEKDIAKARELILEWIAEADNA
ncbi:MAG: sugar phosphate isomerase/epimerase [Clostridia bacterium]|nr:sugar phosphate isomerase/epimerase [Clostridia bacterium]